MIGNHNREREGEKKKKMEQPKSAPTGCYKCGRPGHWSRDCPDSNPTSLIPNSTSNSTNPTTSIPPKSFPFKPSNSNPTPAVPKPKKAAPRTRPKLTPDLLLGDDGFGYVLRFFPRNFRYRGRGHEVSDLGNLIRLYSEWHSHLLPYYSFDQFVNKVEQVAASRRVKTCIGDLRQRVASGGDPTKLHEAPSEHIAPNYEQDLSTPAETVPVSPEVLHHEEDLFSQNASADAMPEGMLQEVYNKEASKNLVNETSGQNQSTSASSSIDGMTEEQRTRMEANRLKALERAAARARLLQPI